MLPSQENAQANVRLTVKIGLEYMYVYLMTKALAIKAYITKII